MNYINIYWAS